MQNPNCVPTQLFYWISLENSNPTPWKSSKTLGETQVVHNLTCFMVDHALAPKHINIDLKINQNRLKTTSNNQSNNSLKNNAFRSRIYNQNGAQNEPQIHQTRPPASIGPAKSIPMIKNTLPTPPKPQFSFIFDLFWTSFGHVFDLKSIYVQTHIECNDPMFKSHNE